MVYSTPAKRTNIQPQASCHIPLSVRYEKELRSDDDMILSNGDTTTYIERQPLKVISDEECVLSRFDASQIRLFLHFIVEWLPLSHALHFMTCCTKYTVAFHGDIHNASLIVYKQIYHRDHGGIKFKFNKKSRINQSEQRRKFKLKLQNHSFWKLQYEYKTSPNYKCPLWYITHHSGSRISILCHEYEASDIRDVTSNDIIIVTKRQCNRYKLFDIRNFGHSNWYKVCWYGRGSDRSNPSYHYLRMLCNNLNDRYYGYKKLRVDSLVRNVSIEQWYGWSASRSRYVFPMRYVQKEYYLKEMKRRDAEDKECCKRKRKCVLRAIENEEKLMSDEVEVEGIVFDRIMEIKTLEMKMHRKWMENGTYLRVMVYVIGLRTESWDEANDFERQQNKAKYVVMRYASTFRSL